MKKPISIFIFWLFFCKTLSFAQSTVLLPNSVFLPKVTSLPTCNNSFEGKQVYNTTDNKMYYCNSSAWQEMAGSSFSLPFYGNGNSNNLGGLFSVNNSGTGGGITGQSASGKGVWGISNNDIGVFGYSNTGKGGYFQTYSDTEPALYAKNFGLGKTAELGGDVLIVGELEVANGKGIIQSSNGLQLKYSKTITEIDATLASNGTFITDPIQLVTFSSNPSVYLADVYNQSGDYYKVMVTPLAVTTDSVRLRFFNPTNSSITFSGTWKIIAIGPK